MLITRTTTRTMANTSAQGVQDNAKRLAQLQKNAIDRVRLTAPSSDASASMEVLKVKADQAASDQYARNLDNASNWLNTIDSSLTTSLTMMRRARTLVIQGANGTNGETSREALAVEIEGMAEELTKVANTSFGGRLVFAGTSDSETAFDMATGAFNGDPGTKVERRIGDDFTLRVDADGEKAFGNGPDSAFQLLRDIANDLRTGADVSARLGSLDKRMEAMTSTLADVGARATTVARAVERNETRKVELEANRSGLEDIDLAEAITALEFQNTYYQAALGVTSKVLKTSLMDYLR